MLGVLTISLEQGLAYALVALGIVISFRVLSFPDLTVDGSFTLGAAVTAKLIVVGVNPAFAVLAALAAGFLAGTLTGFLNTKLKINALLAGILVMTILYSLNLRIMGRANIPLLTVDTLFTPLEEMGSLGPWAMILFFFVLAGIVKVLLDLFFHTSLGLSMRATGDNEQMIRSQGVNTDFMTVLGLGLSNALVALAGAMVCQDQGFADIGMGIGMIILGLASIIIGEAVLRPSSVVRLTLAAVIGSVVYRALLAVGLRLGLAPTDLKLATGVMVILALGIPALKSRERQEKEHFRGV
jgi:putative tryptophan/tyrosine transport system permease protein